MTIYQEAAEKLREISEAPERWAIAFSLVNVAIFYAVIILVFLTARKTRLNVALASQKFIWLAIIATVAIPAYVLRDPWLPMWGRMVLWIALVPISWWVLYEAYRSNWDGTFREYLHFLWRVGLRK